MTYKSMKNTINKIVLTTLLTGAVISNCFGQKSGHVRNMDKHKDKTEYSINKVVDGDTLNYTLTTHKTLFGTHKDALLTVKTHEGISMKFYDNYNNSTIDAFIFKRYPTDKEYVYPGDNRSMYPDINDNSIKVAHDKYMNKL